MRRSGLARLAAAFFCLAAFACGDDPSGPAEPAAPDAVLHVAGNGHFFFNAPLGEGGGSGVFNPRLAPVVEVCRLATSTQPTLATPCAELVVRFETGPGDRYSAVQVDVRHEAYYVNWQISRNVSTAGYYRISVRSAPSTGTNTLLGFADVAIAASSSRAKAMAGPGVLPATTTQTVPIKFRIEEGALCEPGADCFEGSVGPDGGVFVTGAAQAGVDFPAGALPSARTLVIERVDADDVPFCLPTHHPQYEGCYRYRLEPALAPGETFAVEVIVGVCLDPAAVAFEDELELQKWDEVDPATLESLPRREIDFLECEDFVASDAGGGLFSRLARGSERLLEPIVALLAPKPLYAGRSPYGGGLNDFSRIGWVRPLELEVAGGDGQTACVEDAVASDPTVRVTSALTGAPLSGVPVRFDATLGGGAALPAIASTDAEGLTGTGWTLGSAPGANALEAQGLNPLSGFPQWTAAPPVWGSATLTATAEPGIGATFLFPFGEAHAGSAGYASGLTPLLDLCELDGAGECLGTATTYEGFVEHPDHMLYRLAWVPPSLAAGAVYRMAVRVDGRLAGAVRITGDRSRVGSGTYFVESGNPISVKVDLVAGASCAG